MFKYFDEKSLSLTPSVPCISESCIKIKINFHFYFHTSFWFLKRFYEAPQRSVKIKIKVSSLSSSAIATGRVKAPTKILRRYNLESTLSQCIDSACLFNSLSRILAEVLHKKKLWCDERF